MNNKVRFINTQDAFNKCFDSDVERSKYMYMHSIDNNHFFKDIDTRKYVTIIKDGLANSIYNN